MADNATRDRHAGAELLSEAGFDLTPPSPAQYNAIVAELSPEERRILVDHGTERPFCGLFNASKDKGAYACRLCGLPLFRSSTKFESGTGWPSFHSPVSRDHVAYLEDHSYGMVRTEIRCSRCDGHLGHVFPDGPPPSRERYCLNSAALVFVPEGKPLPDWLKRGAPEGQPLAGD